MLARFGVTRKNAIRKKIVPRPLHTAILKVDPLVAVCTRCSRSTAQGNTVVERVLRCSGREAAPEDWQRKSCYQRAAAEENGASNRKKATASAVTPIFPLCYDFSSGWNRGKSSWNIGTVSTVWSAEQAGIGGSSPVCLDYAWSLRPDVYIAMAATRKLQGENENEKAPQNQLSFLVQQTARLASEKCYIPSDCTRNLSIANHFFWQIVPNNGKWTVSERCHSRGWQQERDNGGGEKSPQKKNNSRWLLFNYFLCAVFIKTFVFLGFFLAWRPISIAILVRRCFCLVVPNAPRDWDNRCARVKMHLCSWYLIMQQKRVGKCNLAILLGYMV